MATTAEFPALPADAARRRGSRDQKPYLVIGGGPAGLTAGYLLAKAGKKVIVFEADEQVGGIAKTVVDPDGYRFDLGGHRFFTKNQEVNDLWLEIMGDEFLMRPRMSRIFWRGRYLDYPLKGTDVIKKLGPIELVLCGLSYMWAAIKPKGREDNLEQWVSNRFGKRLYGHFFKSYTEKVWGVPTTEIRAEWAAQRIKGLSFFSAAKAAFFGNKGNIKTLIDKFQYPRYGPGQMWEKMTARIEEMGGEVRLNTPGRRRSSSTDDRVCALPRRRRGHRAARRHLVAAAARHRRHGRPGRARSEVRDAGNDAALPRLPDRRARASTARTSFPDNWIYIHEPDVEVGRIQNFRSWSPWMVPDPDTACVGLEYFCFKGDRPVEHGRRGPRRAGHARARAARPAPSPSRSRRGYVVRVPLAYPMYDESYAEQVEKIRDLARPDQGPRPGRPQRPAPLQQLRSLDAAARCAPWTTSSAAASHDIWAVNVESAYHEEQTDADAEHAYKKVPATPAAEAEERAMAEAA